MSITNHARLRASERAPWLDLDAAHEDILAGRARLVAMRDPCEAAFLFVVNGRVAVLLWSVKDRTVLTVLHEWMRATLADGRIVRWKQLANATDVLMLRGRPAGDLHAALDK